MRYRDATRMGKIYLMPAGVARPVAGWDEQGPDADDPALDARCLAGADRPAQRRAEEPAAQPGVRGRDRQRLFRRDPVGRAATPFRKRSSLALGMRSTLCTAHCARCLPWAIEQLHELVPPRLEVEQRDFLNVHRKGGEACPRCGTRLSQVSRRRLRHDLLPRLPALRNSKRPRARVRCPLAALHLRIKKDPGDDLFSRGATP